MARKNFTSKLIDKEEIKEELKLIDGSSTDYVSPTGNIYKDYGNNKYFKKLVNINKINGYCYVGVTMSDGKNKSCRVHRLVAIAFIPNPNNYDIVGHKNNIKYDNYINNLYWTTTSENTQKAFDDNLIENKKGYEDSQSNPINVYDLSGNLLYSFGSIGICSEKLGISKSTISRQCKGISKSSRCGYVFKYQ